MAALLKNKTTGRWSLQYRAADGSGRRPVLYLGKLSKADAENWRAHVDHLNVAAAAGRSPDLATAQWLQTLQPKQRAKLVKCGLVKPREEERPIPLGPYFQGYIDKRTDLKRRTQINLEQARDKLVEKFKDGSDLRTFTRGDAKDWRRWLAESLSPATVATHIKKVRQVFQDAVDHKLIADNPFAGVKAGKQTNPKRQFYVKPAVARKAIDAATAVEWRTLLALARFGGLRVPSETRGLEWVDVDWARDRFKVRSPKTEHHEGRDFRWVPIFPELRPYLDAASAAAAPEARYVLGSARAENPRTTAMKVVKRAGLTPWPKLFQNLRSSCQTDLENRGFPTHVVCAWLGNTPKVAQAHYLQVTDDDFRAAADGEEKRCQIHSRRDRTEADMSGQSSGKTTDSGGEQHPSNTPKGGTGKTETGFTSKNREKSAVAGAANHQLSSSLSEVCRAGRIARKAGRGPDLKQSLRKIAAATAKGGRR